MHNLSTVFRFEVRRTLKKRSFWISALSFPIIIGIIFAVIFFSNKASEEAAQNLQSKSFSFAVTDESGLLNPSLAKQSGASITDNKQAAIDQVKSGELDAYFYYPKQVRSTSIEIYAKDVGIFDNSQYEATAKALLLQSVQQTVDIQKQAVLQDSVTVSTTAYRDGAVTGGFQEVIAPGIFLVLFYILIAMFGSQMLTSSTEEKENRVIEMILTTIEARTLVIGKILSLIVLAFIQIIVIVVPVLIAYLLYRDSLALPAFDLSHIPIDPLRILVGAVFFILSFLLFTGLLVAIGAAMPTAKEASGFFGIVMLFLFAPLYAVTLFVSSPESLIVQVLSYFPLTAPIPLMLRNAVGNLSGLEIGIATGILAISATIALAAAIRLFRYGSLEYSNKLSLKTLFRRS